MTKTEEIKKRIIRLNKPHKFIFSTTGIGEFYSFKFCKCGLIEDNPIHLK